MKRGKPKFQIGQQVRHKLFHYAGIIVGVDPVFKSTDEWYEMMAKFRPPKLIIRQKGPEGS